MRKLTTTIILSTLISTFALADTTSNNSADTFKVICDSTSLMSKVAMDARQNNLTKDQTTAIMQRLFTYPMLVASINRFVDEAYFYPVVEKKSDKELIISAYSTAFYNKCINAKVQRESQELLKKRDESAAS